MAVIPGGSHPVPDGAKQSGADLALIQNLTDADVRNHIKSQALLPWQSAHGLFFTNIIGGIGKAIWNGVNGVANTIGSWAGIFHQSGTQIRDGQRDLLDRTDLLSPLLDYCSVSSNPGSGEHRVSNNRFPFNYEIGPSRGVTIMGDGRLRLDGKGLWDLRAMITASWKVGDEQIQVFLRVLNPDGGLHSVYSEQGYYMKTLNNVTMTLVSSVVVPEPGYFVDMYIIGPGDRGYWVGPKWNRLTVQHISNRVENGTGSEGSAEPTDPPEDPETPTDPVE